MKSILISTVYRFAFVLLTSFVAVVLHAQDSTRSSITTTTTTKTTTTEWYTQPWVWIAGGAVFIIILVALLRGNSSRDREVTRTTVVKSDRPY